MIKKLERRHIPQLAKIHKNNLPSFLSEFPLSFIEKFYELQFERQNQILLGAFMEKRLVGFVFGTDNVEKLFEDFLSKHWLLFYRNTFLALFTNPKFALLYLAKSSSKTANSTCKRHLVYIAVDSKTGKKGFGSALLNAFEDGWKQYEYYELEVDSNNEAYEFYKKNGFFLVDESNYWVGKKYLMGKHLK